MNNEKASVVFIGGKYGVILDGKNWIVAELNAPGASMDVRIQDFNTNSYTYHQNIRQAIIELSDRLTKDSIRKSVRKRPLSLVELIAILKENDRWMRKAIMGREVGIEGG